MWDLPAGAEVDDLPVGAEVGSDSEPEASAGPAIVATEEWPHRDYYAQLGIEKSSTQQQINTAYRNVTRKCHPDKCDVSQYEQATEHQKRLNEAHDVLGNPTLRAKYDAVAGIGSVISHFIPIPRGQARDDRGGTPTRLTLGPSPPPLVN